MGPVEKPAYVHVVQILDYNFTNQFSFLSIMLIIMSLSSFGWKHPTNIYNGIDYNGSILHCVSQSSMHVQTYADWFI